MFSEVSLDSPNGSAGVRRLFDPMVLGAQLKPTKHCKTQPDGGRGGRVLGPVVARYSGRWIGGSLQCGKLPCTCWRAVQTGHTPLYECFGDDRGAWVSSFVTFTSYKMGASLNSRCLRGRPLGQKGT